MSGEPPEALQRGEALTLGYKVRYLQPVAECEVRLGPSDQPQAGTPPHPTDSDFRPSAHWSLPGWSETERRGGGGATLHVRFAAASRAVTPKQAFVLYDGEVCLGGGFVRHPCPSLHEQGLPLPEEWVGAAT